MAFNIHRIGRTYLWVCLVAIVLIALPVLKYVFIFALNVVILPISIIISVSRGNYGEAFFQFLCAAGISFAIYKYFDRILQAAAWVYIVVGGLFRGQAKPTSLEVVHGENGGNTMSHDFLKRRFDRLKIQPTGLFGNVVEGIEARFSLKTTEEKTKVLRAQAAFVQADDTLGQAMLAHTDTAVELQDENVYQRCENKQAELDIKAMERQSALRDAKKKFDEANAVNGKTPQQLEAEQFERKRTYRSLDAKDDVFEGFEFEATKDLELGKQYVKMRDKIRDDKELDDEVRNELLEKLKQKYKTNLAEK